MTNLNIGFISFRISGTDGVSLETKKWAEVFENMGHKAYFMAGELDTPEDRSFIFEPAHFSVPKVKDLYNRCFDQSTRDSQTTRELHKAKDELKEALRSFVSKFSLDLIVPQNTLTIPLNLPLGMALTEFIVETGIPTIAHHHDFYWERQRFIKSSVQDILNASFPPDIPSIQHVVINSEAQSQLARRTGAGSTLIPNVMDFDNPPAPMDAYSKDVREALGIEKDQLIVLQPTRVVQRKGIEHAIEFVHRLEQNAVLVISHASGDEGYAYENRVREFAELLKVETRFVDDVVTEQRSFLPDGRKTYTLQDVYRHADFVTYPSLIEGFGNAFLEAVYFHRKIMVNHYSVYDLDIEPKGFEAIDMSEFIGEETMKKAHHWLANPDMVKEHLDKNYAIAKQHFSYTTLRRKLEAQLQHFWGAAI